ncbi:GNAT family N-acetyltransferase [Cohnella lupini]|uniref:RimJ/RimL family protein N-acetyltransferase n=1 Tax=Cohnella lupini TaxID=1294267 RepID=A0A3D9HNV7_9BACL|nr:GNAT family N-acetyltransferase [Cohnella lupini]RED51180.1 RimJ/RimL family protein N-acetyltransferase [Cohnella lupini]
MSDLKSVPNVKIETWSDTDLDLLRLINSPEMTEHLGGPETEEQILSRHKRYLDIEGRGTGRMFRIVTLPEQESVGSVGYWDRKWKEETVYETGWSIVPPYQGRGLATAGVAEAIASAAREHKHRYIHAFPSIDNPASNAVCRKLNFTLMGQCEFEYPPGNMMQCNDWRLDLDTITKRS